MEEKKIKLISYIITLTFVILNTIMYHQYLFINFFALIYLIIAYKKFATDAESYLFFSTIVLAITSGTMILPVSQRYGVYYFYITTILYYFIFFKNNIGRYKTEKLKNKYTVFGIIFYIYLIFSVLLSAYKMQAVKSIIVYSFMIMLAIMFILQNKNRESLKNTFMFLLYMFVGILLLGNLEIMGFRYGARNHYTDLGLYAKNFPLLKRITVVFFYNPNNYALVLVLAMLLLFAYYYTANDKRIRVFCLILFIDAQINLIFTTSRTAWITLILGLAFSALLFIIKRNKNGLKALGRYTLLVFAIFIAFSFLPGMSSYYGKFNSTPILRLFNINTVMSTKKAPDISIKIGEAGSMNERFTLMADVAEGVLLKGHILGFGAGNAIYYIKSLNNTHGVINEHSLWFEILGDFGIFIFLYFIFFYLSMLKDMIKIYKNGGSVSKYYFMSAGCIFSLIFLVFGPSSVINFPAFWIMLGLSLSLLYNREEFMR